VSCCAEAERRGCVGGSGADAVGGVASAVSGGETAAPLLLERGRCVCGFGIGAAAVVLLVPPDAPADPVEGGAAVPLALSSSGLRTGEGEKESGASSTSVGET
jgi:hypothetical protein